LAGDAALPKELEGAGGEEGKEEDGAAAIASLCEFDPPLGLFLARLGMLQHLPALAADEMSLDLLHLLPEDDLHSNLSEMGLKRGACCRIILGLRALADDGAGTVCDNDDVGAGGGSGGAHAADTAGGNGDSEAEAAETAENPAWCHGEVEDIS